MKTAVAATSVNAYKGLLHKPTQCERIYDYIGNNPATIAMIGRGLRMEKSTVSARVNSMVNGNRGAEKRLEYSHTDRCPVTGIHAKFWKQAPQYMSAEDVHQLSLEDGINNLMAVE